MMQQSQAPARQCPRPSARVDVFHYQFQVLLPLPRPSVNAVHLSIVELCVICISQCHLAVHVNSPPLVRLGLEVLLVIVFRFVPFGAGHTIVFAVRW